MSTCIICNISRIAMEFNNISLQKTNGKMIPIPSGPKSSAFAGERLRPLASKIPQESRKIFKTGQLWLQISW
jgi:hypothetical protein